MEGQGKLFCRGDFELSPEGQGARCGGAVGGVLQARAAETPAGGQAGLAQETRPVGVVPRRPHASWWGHCRDREERVDARSLSSWDFRLMKISPEKLVTAET